MVPSLRRGQPEVANAARTLELQVRRSARATRLLLVGGVLVTKGSVEPANVPRSNDEECTGDREGFKGTSSTLWSIRIDCLLL